MKLANGSPFIRLQLSSAVPPRNALHLAKNHTCSHVNAIISVTEGEQMGFFSVGSSKIPYFELYYKDWTCTKEERSAWLLLCFIVRRQIFFSPLFICLKRLPINMSFFPCTMSAFIIIYPLIVYMSFMMSMAYILRRYVQGKYNNSDSFIIYMAFSFKSMITN